MVVVVVVEHYKAVVVFSLLRVVEWTGPPDPVICGKNWCKMRYYQSLVVALVLVFSARMRCWVGLNALNPTTS